MLRTTRALEALATTHRPPKRLGRKPKPRFERSLGRVAKMLDRDGFEDLDAVSGFDEAKARALLETTRKLRVRLDAVETRLTRRL